MPPGCLKRRGAGSAPTDGGSALVNSVCMAALSAAAGGRSKGFSVARSLGYNWGMKLQFCPWRVPAGFFVFSSFSIQ